MLTVEAPLVDRFAVDVFLFACLLVCLFVDAVLLFVGCWLLLDVCLLFVVCCVDGVCCLFACLLACLFVCLFVTKAGIKAKLPAGVLVYANVVSIPWLQNQLCICSLTITP